MTQGFPVKKINAIVGFVAIICLIGHFGTMSYSLFTGWYDYVICKNLAHITAITVCIHIVLVALIFFFFHEGSNLLVSARENVRVILQRASGIVMVLLLHRHVVNYGFIASGESLTPMAKVILIVSEIIFFATVFTHVATSFSNLWITLGVLKTQQGLSRVNTIVYVVCAGCFIWIVFSMVRFVVSFGG